PRADRAGGQRSHRPVAARARLHHACAAARDRRRAERRDGGAMTGARTLGLTVVVLAACNTDRSPTGAARADTGAGRADTGAGRAGTGAAEAEGSPARHYFGDAVLVDQNGERHRFYTDLVRDRTVIIDVFFTHCTASCPIVAGTFARVQDHLGERL